MAPKRHPYHCHQWIKSPNRGDRQPARKSRTKPELLPSLFHDIRDYESVRIKKRELLWMPGRFHETPSVRDMLMREWRRFDPVRPLYGMHWNDEITLAMARSHEIASDWTTRREKPDLLALVP